MVWMKSRGRRSDRVWIGLWTALWTLSFVVWLAAGNSSDVPTAESVVKEAAQALRKGPPKKLKTRGKSRIIRWEDLDAALAKLPSQMDYESLDKRLRDLMSKDTGFAPNNEVLGDIIGRTLAQEEVRYADLFTQDDGDLLPITNTVLKFLPEETWKDVPVYDKKGQPLGRFMGKYPYEKSGGLLTTKTYRVYYFQYLDKENTSQTAAAPDYIERDAFCVRWADVKDRPALTLATMKP